MTYAGHGITEEASALFSYSNGWWRVQYNYLQPSNMVGTVVDCKNIPDGVRCFLVDPRSKTLYPEAATAASVLPIKFPMAELLGCLATWLCLCPEPELPMLDEGKMSNFFVRYSLYSNTNNTATYALEHIGPERLFVSRLSVTNNGMLLKPGGAAARPPHPYDAEFLEWDYEVLSTTNIGGVTYPQAAVLSQYPRSSSRGDSRAKAVTEIRLTVREVNGTTDGLASFKPTPPMVAIDQRPPGLPHGITMNHTVTGDTWLAVSDPKMKRLANAYRQTKKPPTKKLGRGMVLITLAILGVVPLTAILVRKKLSNQHKQES